MSDQFELDFDAKVKEADDIEIAEYNFSPTLLENGVIDYSEIQHDKIFLVNKKDILEKARPNWIPELDITGLLEDDFLPTTIKSSDGYYYVQTKKYVGMETNERTRVLEKKFETQIYKMSSDILAATVDYYIKKQRAENKKNGIKKTVSLPRRTKSMLTTRYNNMVELLRFIPEYKDNDELLRKYPNRSKSTAYKNQNTIIFNQYNELLSVLKGKTLDLNLAKQDFINAYAKGEITSYGDTGISNALYQDYGVKIKKQNGSTFSLEERSKLTDALDSVYNYYGNLSNLAKQYGLKISYADNCKQHARKAIGLFTNYHKAIGVSFFNDLNDESLTMAHETAHWLDSLKGKEFSYRMASDKDGTIENKIAEKYKKLIKEENERQKDSTKLGRQKDSTKLGDYWYRTCECFARAIEQDFGLTIGLKERCHPPAYLPEEIFNKEIKPLIEELKKENEIKLNLIPGKFVTWTTKNTIKEELKEQEKENMSDVFDNKIENNEEYANELADWIIQESLECSVNKENYHISFEDIVEKTNTPIEWLNKNYKLVNEALAKHNDNELLEYNPEESNENEFNLNFCSNATENDKNTLFKQNKQGRWVRKTEEELEQELKNNTKEIENTESIFDIKVTEIFDDVSKEFDEKNKDFFASYEEIKLKQLENVSKFISDAHVRMVFTNSHSNMLIIRVEELKEMVKRCPSLEIALAVGRKYFNYLGNPEENLSHLNLYTQTNIGHYENGQMVYPTQEELKSFISKLYENSKKQETYIWNRYEDGSCYLKAPNGEQYFVYDPDADEVQIKEDSNWIRIDELNLGDKTFTQYAEDYILEKNPATYISFETNGKNIEKEQNVDESKQYSFFVKDTAEFEMFEEFETITGLTAKEAISEYKKLREDGLAAGIGINIPSDTTFNDPKGLGTTILVRENGIDTFDIYGDSFIVDLKENNERSQNRIAAYKELYEEAKAQGLNVKEPTFLFEKERELGLPNKHTILSGEKITEEAKPYSTLEQNVLTETCFFDGKEYFGRYVEIEHNNGEKETLLMYEDSLGDIVSTYFDGTKEIVSEEDKKLSSQAQSIDEDIYCYVPKDILTQSNEVVIKWCQENNIDIDLGIYEKQKLYIITENQSVRAIKGKDYYLLPTYEDAENYAERYREDIKAEWDEWKERNTFYSPATGTYIRDYNEYGDEEDEHSPYDDEPEEDLDPKPEKSEYTSYEVEEVDFDDERVKKLIESNNFREKDKELLTSLGLFRESIELETNNEPSTGVIPEAKQDLNQEIPRVLNYFGSKYDLLYETVRTKEELIYFNNDVHEVTDVLKLERYLVDLFDSQMKENEKFKTFVQNAAKERGDIFSSDRECAALLLAIKEIGPGLEKELELEIPELKKNKLAALLKQRSVFRQQLKELKDKEGSLSDANRLTTENAINGINSQIRQTLEKENNQNEFVLIENPSGKYFTIETSKKNGYKWKLFNEKFCLINEGVYYSKEDNHDENTLGIIDFTKEVLASVEINWSDCELSELKFHEFERLQETMSARNERLNNITVEEKVKIVESDNIPELKRNEIGTLLQIELNQSKITEKEIINRVEKGKNLVKSYFFEHWKDDKEIGVFDLWATNDAMRYVGFNPEIQNYENGKYVDVYNQEEKKELEKINQTMKNLLNEYSSELIERINNGSNKFLFIFEKLQAAGIEVVIDKDEYQWMKEHIDEINITLNMLDEKPLQIQFNEKKEIEELSTSYNDTQTRSQSLNTKIILDSLNSQVFINNLNSLSNIKNKIDSKEFLSSLKKAFYLDDTKSSNYVHNKSNNTELRISNHCANAISSKKYDKSTSIVIKLVRGKNAPKFRKSPEADLIEFAYYPENLTLEAEKEIINGLIDWIKTGEYTYSQADEVHQSTRKNFVNKNKNQNFITQDGRTYGFTHEGKIYLNPEILSSEAALHEYTHLWDNYTKVTNPELWNKGKEVFKNTYLWEEVKNDEHYQDISHDEDLILSECHARITGKIADKILDKIQKENGELTKDTVIDWNKEVFEYISKEFTGKDIDIQSVSEFVSQTMKDFMDGRVMETLGKTMEQQSYKYYTKRPVDIGTVPKGFASFENYDYYKYNEEAGREVYGFVEYDRELSEEEIKEFELFKPNPYREFRIEPTKENGLKEPYILTGRRGSLQGTSLSNFEAYIQDARKVHDFNFLDSIEETIQFIENGFKRPKDTSLTINIKDYEIVKTDNKTEELSLEDIKLINNFKKENNLNLLNNPSSVELVTDEIKSDEVAILFNYDIDKSKLNDLFVIDEHHNNLLSDKDNNVKLSFKVSSGSLSNIDIQCYKENKIYNLSFWSDVTDTARKELCNLLKEPFKSINNNIDFTQKGWNDEWHKIHLEQAELVNKKDNRNWILHEAPTGSLSKYISSDKVVDIDEFREFAASKLEGNAEDKTYFKQMWILGAKFCKEKGWDLPEISLSELLDEPGEKYNKDLIKIFADNEEFEQISNNKYVMKESEFNVVDKILTESKMYNSFFVLQIDNNDMFQDFDEEKIVSLKTGLSWLSDGLVEPTTDELSVEELSILKELLCKQNLFDKVDYINGLLEERSSEHPVSFSLRDITDEQLTELKEHLSNNGYDVQWKEKVQSSTSNSSWNNFTIELENYPYIITILEDRNLDFEYLVGLTSFGYDAAWLNFEDQKNTKFVTETEFKKINELNEKEFKDSHRPYIKINYTESWAKNHKPTRIEKGTVLGFVEGIKLIDELNKKFNTSLKSDISFYMWDEKQNDYVEYDPGFEFHDNIRTLDNGKEIPYTQTPITEEIRMICSYPEILDLFEENWIKQFAPTITDEQKNFIKELTDASYTKLNERYNQGKETLRFIYDKYNEVHSSSIIEADVADATEQSLEIQQQAIARLFDKTLELFVTKIDLYLDENKDLLNKKEFLEYAKHKIFNVLQDVQFQESRNAKYGKNGYDFDFAFWNVTNEKILAAGDYNTEFEKILAIKEKSLQQTEEYAKEISNTFNSQNNEVTLQNLSDIPLMPKVTIETKTQIIKENIELPFSIINNVEKGRVNIKFNQKISDKKFNSILKELKSAGWKFSSFNKQWYPDGKAVEKSETFAKELQEKFSISEEKMTFAANTIKETEVRIQNTPYGNVRFFGRNYKELDEFVTYFNRNLDKFSKNVEKIDESIAETIFESLKIERSSAINVRSLRLGLDSADNLVLLDKEKSNTQTIVISLPELLSLAKSNLEKEKDEIDFKLAKFEKAENKEHYIKVFGNLFQNAKDKNTNLLSKMNLIYETYISESKSNPKYEVLYPITKYGFKNKLKQIYEIDKHINNDILSVGKKLLSLATEDDKKEISEWLKNDMGCEDENSLKKLFTNWVSEKEVKQQKKKDGYPSRGE